AAELVDLVTGGEAGALAEVVHPVGAAAVGAAVGEHEVAVAVPVDLGLEVLRDQLVAAVEELRAPRGGVVDAGGGEIGVGDRAPAGRGRRAALVDRGGQLRQHHVEFLRLLPAGHRGQLAGTDATGCALRRRGGRQRGQLRVVCGFVAALQRLRRGRVRRVGRGRRRLPE